MPAWLTLIRNAIETDERALRVAKYKDQNKKTKVAKMHDIYSSAFDWGAKAARQGLDASDNPYLDSRDRANWNAGFAAATLDDHDTQDFRRAA